MLNMYTEERELLRKLYMVYILVFMLYFYCNVVNVVYKFD